MPGACSPVVSLYSRPTKKEMPMGAASRRRRGWASFVSPSLSSPSRLHLPSFRFMLLYVPLWRTVELTDSSEPISRRFCSPRADVHSSMVATSILPSEAWRDIGTRSHVITSTKDFERLDASMPEPRFNSWQQIGNATTMASPRSSFKRAGLLGDVYIYSELHVSLYYDRNNLLATWKKSE